MKRIGAFSLAFFIFTLSVFAFIPIGVYANDAYVISKNSDEVTALSSSEAQAAIDANSDIKGKDGVTMLLYTPTDTYNYTLKSGAFVCHMSDAQAKAMLMSSKSYQQYVVLVSSLLSNNSVIRGFVSSVGALTTKDSKTLTNILDDVTCNYNYLDSLNYDEDSQTITMSNDNGSVDKLRDEIKDYYYESLGISILKPSGKPSDGVYEIRSSYDDQDEYNHDLTAANDFDYAFFTNNTRDSLGYTLSMFNKKDIGYLFLQVDSSGSWSPRYLLMSSNDGVTSVNTFNFMKVFYNKYNTSDFSAYYANYSYQDDTFIGYGAFPYNYPTQLNFHPQFIKGKEFAKNPTSTTIYDLSGHDDYFQMKFYSKDNSSLVVFKSLSALYNYIQGDQSAYLTKTINDTGKDISYSIKNMDENLGSKLDTLIDTINEDKKTMSADELQNAIDKGLEDLNKNTEDIKDNTSSILDKLEEQNQILLQILGVTEFIAYQEVKENSDQYNMSYLKTLLDSMFTGLFNALMYGENTVDDNNTDTASMQSFSVSNAAAPVAVYSDDIAVYDSSGSSFGGGSDSSGGHFFNLKNGLFGKFPFSIPYQCYNWLQILQREPEAPSFSLDYGYLFGAVGASEYVLTFDLSRYNDIAEVGRSFCRLFMTLMLALGIYHKNKGEM